MLVLVGMAALCPTSATADPPLTLAQYIHKAWQSDAGLPQTSVTSIAQTLDGYLWFGTEEGLVRFDGLKFATFDRQNTPALRSRMVVSLLLDREGTLWIGTHGGGLLSLKDGRFAALGPVLGTGSETVSALYQDEQGDLWIGTDGGGLFRLHSGRFRRFVQKDGLQDDSVFSITGDGKGTLWIGTRRGISRFSNGSFTALPAALSLGTPQVRSVHVDSSGTLWMAVVGRGLYRFNEAGLKLFTAKDGLSSNSPSSIYEDRSGSLWIGTFDNGVSRLLEGRFDSFTPEDGFPGSGVWTSFEDRDGTVWLGGTEGGLNSLRPGVFTPMGPKEGLASDMSLGILEAHDGSIWIGSDKGVTCLRNGKSVKYSVKDGLPDNLVLSLAEDGQGTIWAGTRTGLARFAGNAFQRVGASQGFVASGAVLCAFADRHGQLWAGGHGTLSRFDGQRFHTFGTSDGLPNNPVIALYQDDHDTLWIGTDGGGLVRFRNGQFTTLTTQDGLPVNMIWAILGDAGDTLWLGTNGGGLVRFSGTKFVAFSREQGLVDSSVFRILDDGRGRLWLTSNKGVSSVDKQSLLALARANPNQAGSPRVLARLYGPGAGMRTSECNGGFQPAGWKTRDGRLWFPTMRGVVILNPSKSTYSETLKRVIVERVDAGNRPVPHAELRAIPPSRRALEFQFTSPSFREPEKLEFKYRLDGFDEGWVLAGARRTAFYTNLPPGEYRFEVVACLEGVCTPDPAAIEVKLLPAFYETLAFKLLLLLALLALAGFGHKLRVRHLRAKELLLKALIDERTRELVRSRDELRDSRDQLESRVQERTQDLSLTNQRLESEIAVRREAEIKADAASRAKSEFLANMSHELRTPMNGVMGLTDLALEYATNPLQREYLQLAAQSAEHLLAVLNDLLDFSKIDGGRIILENTAFDLHNLIEKTARMIAPSAAAKGLTLLVDIESSVPRQTKGDPTRLRQALLNLLTNAVKFTEAGEIILSATQSQPGFVRMTVSDTGTGVPEGKQEAIFDPFVQADASITRRFGGTGLGLPISRRLVTLMGGTLTVDSRPGEGSRFSITLPAEAAAAQTEPEPNVAGLSGHAVLLYEPNQAAHDMVMRWLHTWGLCSESLPDLRPESFSKLQRQFEVVLLDVCKTDLADLLSVEQIIRLHQPGARPIMMFVPSLPDQAAAPSPLLENWERLTKPVSASELRTTLVRIIGANGQLVPAATLPHGIAEAAAPHRPLKVLVAEDNIINQRVVKAVLERTGCKVEIAGNGAEAVAACSRDSFDLVLMDLQMPVMDGFEATEEIRRLNADGYGPTVVALTAHAMAADRERCLEAGMDDYLSKPIDLARLSTILNKLAARENALLQPADVPAF